MFLFCSYAAGNVLSPTFHMFWFGCDATYVSAPGLIGWRVWLRILGVRCLLALHEPYANLYVGDYFSDTLHLTANEHRVLRLLLLETWVRSSLANARLAKVARVTTNEWKAVKPVVLPLLANVRPKIAESHKQLRTFDGKRLPSADWDLVRSIIFERDGHICTYCSSHKHLEGDHILPLSRGGSNAFDNLATACRSCNQAKGSKTLEEWRAAKSSR